jgi:23S rRNA (guanine745-N1)-methyltransferase
MNLTALACPVCGDPLIKNSDVKQYSCANRHSYDIAKEGYVNLLMSYHKHSDAPGDSKEMVDARTRFLSKNYYAPIAQGVLETIHQLLVPVNQDPLCAPSILDLGCGEGYYLDTLAQGFNNKGMEAILYGQDLSKRALKVAGKRNRSITWLVGNNFFTPMADQALDFVVSIFSPTELSECARILKLGGYLIKIFPNRNHLMAIKEIVYPMIKDKDYKQYEEGNDQLHLLSTERLTYTITLDKDSIWDLLVMTPHFWRVKTENKERLLSMEGIDVCVDITIAVFNKIG